MYKQIYERRLVPMNNVKKKILRQKKKRDLSEFNKVLNFRFFSFMSAVSFWYLDSLFQR